MLKSEHVLLLLSIIVSVSATVNDTIEYASAFLERFGYMNTTDNAITDIESALMTFQETYNLPVSGSLNNETLRLLNSPRCSVGENNFMIHSKWNKTTLRWYFPQAQRVHRDAVKMAFDRWEEISNLKFENVRNPSKQNPDITLTVIRKNHNFRANCQGTSKCPYNFDGPGKVLAHSFFPNENNKCVEIHLDAEEKWYLGNSTAPDGQTSLLMVLMHEIGHALGLGHSAVNTAIMYPWYQVNPAQFDIDDKRAIEYLYGQKTENYQPTTQKTKPTTQTTKPQKPKFWSVDTPTITEPSNKPHSVHVPSTTSKPPITQTRLCDIQVPDFMFLAIAPQFQNYRMYVGHNRLLWKIDLNDMRIPSQPELLDDYLPEDLKSSRVSHVFQNSVGNLVTFINDSMYYAASFPNFQIHQNFRFPLPSKAKINAVFQTNSGQAYLLYNNDSYIAFDDNGDMSNRGPLSHIFPGIPAGIISAFRYIDGNIYFFDRNTYYKYSEYTRRVVKAEPFSWSIFGISCPNDGLLYQLKTMLSRIISLYE